MRTFGFTVFKRFAVFQRFIVPPQDIQGECCLCVVSAFKFRSQ
jgi:hypothetical protein